ncbi:O-antigen ligase family protein [Bacillus subtilis]|uniref:O-antigen ligase family protein n=1 Tax=Pseudochrobactrum asaccharolyticum TaxID=354351 RepID=UPI001F491568|nr:O-antigen ligase family protein [Pseudochrobactrum asaccharolyticum]MCF7671156.1 O-antigen ligase family protein [Bacillus subtilis]
MLALMTLWLLSGLRLSIYALTLLLLFTLFNIGGVLSIFQMDDLKKAPLYIAVSYFLALTAVFFAAVTESDWRRLQPLFTGYMVAATLTSLLGIGGYLNIIPAADLFTLYGRAKGAFQDPNVFGPFLILPINWCLYQILTRPFSKNLLYWALFMILTLAVLLSFSRAAWGMFIISLLLIPVLLFIRSTDQQFRGKIVFISIAALLVLALAMLIALQIPQISEIFYQRARLEHEYDSARTGRFARHWLGLLLSMESPFGIGPLEFGPMFGEDTHNMWLKALLDYGWIGFLAFMILIILTLALGFKLMLRERPWQPYLLCSYVAFLAHLVIGNVIDIDHWRHFYLIIGIIWGCAALEQRYQKQYKSQAFRT